MRLLFPVLASSCLSLSLSILSPLSPLSTVPSLAAAEQVVPPGFTALFDGQSLAGWWGATTEDPRKWQALPPEAFARKHEASLKDIRLHWTVVDGELINDGQGLYLTTERQFGDFELRVEYRTVPKADSGIYLKGCPQVQIWDYTEKAKFPLGADKGSGGLWNNSPGAPGKDPLVLADKPFGEWNAVRVIQCGSRTWVWLNGKVVVDGAILENYFDRKRPIPPLGPLQLQTHGGEIRWRNLVVREIPGDEANHLLRGEDPPGFAPVFNGRDLAGWKGPVGDYQVQDGAILCRPDRGGTICTAEEYGDFIVRLEYQLPPAGRSGLAIRYPGEGDAASTGMCEIPVLDDTAAPYAQLDARQFNGSAHGIIASHRGYLRPVGAWNYQEVTVKGSTIRVELNGTVILQGDVAKVNGYLAGTAHPGKDLRRGAFGLVGRNAAVRFRAIAIRKLD